jgi:hypothetical protein
MARKVEFSKLTKPFLISITAEETVFKLLKLTPIKEIFVRGNVFSDSSPIRINSAPVPPSFLNISITTSFKIMQAPLNTQIKREELPESNA